MHFCSKLIKEMQKILKTNPKIFTTDYCEFNATYNFQVPNRDNSRDKIQFGCISAQN